VPVFPAEVVARIELGPAFVVFPNFVVLRLSRLAAKRTLFEDIALSVTIQFQKSGLLGPVRAIGENNEYLTLHCGQSMAKKSASRHSSLLPGGCGLTGKNMGGEPCFRDLAAGFPRMRWPRRRDG
jgi:hypothetical protein